MRSINFHIALALLALFSTSPSWAEFCYVAGAVSEMEDGSSGGWLAKPDVLSVRGALQSRARGESYWEGDNLVTSCSFENGEKYTDVTAASVSSISSNSDSLPGENLGVKFARKYFTDLAVRTGHTPQEAEALYKKYTGLGFFRYVNDGNGGQQSEAEIVWNRRVKALGLGEPELKSADAMDEGKMKVLAEQIKAAQAKGDMQAVMRLAMEAQAMTQPVQQEVAKAARDKDRQTWLLLEQAYPELAPLSYQSRIEIGIPVCLQCGGAE